MYVDNLPHLASTDVEHESLIQIMVFKYLLIVPSVTGPRTQKVILLLFSVILALFLVGVGGMQEVCVWEVRVRTNGRESEGGRGPKRRGGRVDGGREQGRQPWRRSGRTIPCQAAEAAARTAGSVRGVPSGHSRRQQQQHVWVRATGPPARSPTASEEAEESAGSSAGTKWARPPSTWEQIPAERKWASQPALSLWDGAEGALIGALPNSVSFSSSDWQRETGRIQGRAAVWKGKARFVNSSHSWHGGFLKVGLVRSFKLRIRLPHAATPLKPLSPSLWPSAQAHFLFKIQNRELLSVGCLLWLQVL